MPGSQQDRPAHRRCPSVTICRLLGLLAWIPAFVTGADTYRNPVIPGHWPDAGIVRQGEDYYSICSWYYFKPGPRILHSKDLVHWRYAGNVSDNVAGQTTAGVRNGGIWGVDLGYNPNNRTFIAYLSLRAPHDSIVAYWSKDPAGPYEGPYPVLENAYDPGFFADDDGRLYLVARSFSHEVEHEHIHRLSRDGLAAVESIPILGEDPTGLPFAFEGPDIFKRGGYYYLLDSPGGTSTRQHHQVRTRRSRSLEGPWEWDPANPQLYAPHETGARFQGPGHGTLVETQNGEWFVFYQAYELSHYTLARQQFMEPVVWEDGWWRPVGGPVPSVEQRRPDLPWTPFQLAQNDEFDRSTLGLQWHFHAIPDFTGASWSLQTVPGKMRVNLRGNDLSDPHALTTVFLQRVIDKHFAFSTKIEFEPTSPGQLAGLHLFHDRLMNLWLASTIDEAGRPVIELGKFNEDRGGKAIVETVPNPHGSPVHLKIAVDGNEGVRFAFGPDGERWTGLESELYIGDSETDLRNGKAGDPDLGWVGKDKRNRSYGASFGFFAIGGDEAGTEGVHADFEYFRVLK